ncbi:MAG TPA: hypothetical protein VF707_10640 [Ardenticatenaceae bacterium]|jgi:predicted DNA-binding protein
MTTITVKIADSLYQQAESLAAERGESVELLVQELVAEYLEQLEDVRVVREIEARIATGEEEVSNWADFEAELDALEVNDRLSA